MVNFFAPINYLGYGIHSYNTIKAYYDNFNKNVSLIPPFGQTQWRDKYIDEWLSNRKKISSKDIGIMIFNEPFLSQFSGSTRIGFPVFEMEKFTELNKVMMRSCDHLFTPSQWAKEIIKQEVGNIGVDVIPEGYDPLIYHPRYSLNYKLNRIEEEGLYFVHVGKWEERKGTKDILTTFLDAFRGKKIKVTLIIKAENMFNPNWQKEIIDFLPFGSYKSNQGEIIYACDNVTVNVLAPAHRTFKEIADLYRRADFGIWLSKAEGWNLPLMECIACGTPAITTSWTGMSEYMSGYPEELKITDFKSIIANDGQWFHGDKGEWKTPALDQVRAILEAIAFDPEKYLLYENKCMRSIENFTWENAAKKMQEALKKLGGCDDM